MWKAIQLFIQTHPGLLSQDNHAARAFHTIPKPTAAIQILFATRILGVAHRGQEQTKGWWKEYLIGYALLQSKHGMDFCFLTINTFHAMTLTDSMHMGMGMTTMIFKREIASLATKSIPPIRAEKLKYARLYGNRNAAIRHLPKTLELSNGIAEIGRNAKTPQLCSSVSVQ